jgi:lipopolysaccharide export LptBFGC system permease protein LptF
MRSGRSAGALTAIGVMALYWLAFSLADMASTRGWVPAWIGFWTPNALALAIGIALMRRLGRSDD